MSKNAPTTNNTAKAFAEPVKNATTLASPSTNATMAAHPFFAQAEPAKNATASTLASPATNNTAAGRYA